MRIRRWPATVSAHGARVGEPDEVSDPNAVQVRGRREVRTVQAVRLTVCSWTVFLRGPRTVHTPRPSRLARWGLGAAALAAAVPLTAFPSAAHADASDVFGWLEGELADNGDALPQSLRGQRLGADARRRARADARRPRIQIRSSTRRWTTSPRTSNAYITGEAFGDVGSTYAGATGKTLLTVGAPRRRPQLVRRRGSRGPVALGHADRRCRRGPLLRRVDVR